jgi:anti-sigma regulatory factor (Ser/Thr protein kinase)
VSAPEFWHGALLYANDDEYAAGTVPFIGEALSEGAPVLVAVGPAKTALLKRRLGRDHKRVMFVDMAGLGQNPARIIPAWRRFVQDHGGDRHLWGIGEPIWAERSPDELLECQRHETLLNNAFAGGQAWSLLCPYDVNALAPDVIEEAHRSHPYVASNGVAEFSSAYRGLEFGDAAFDSPLPPPPADAATFAFDSTMLAALRDFVEAQAIGADFEVDQAADLVLAVNEIATNSVRYGGGGGTLSIWLDGARLLCDVTDSGHITDPLVDREPPVAHAAGRRGLYLANQLCNLVQLRSSPAGTTVRLHLYR